MLYIAQVGTQQAHSQILRLDAESFHDSSIVHNAICRHQQGKSACNRHDELSLMYHG